MKLFLLCFLALAFNSIQYSSSLNAGAAASKPKASVSAPAKPNNDASAQPPNGYVITTKNSKFISAVKLNTNKLDWNGARKACFHEGHGAFLAYPTTKQEEQMYLKMMAEKKVNDLWVGIHDLFENNGQYSTVRGEVAKEAAHFTWFPGEPNSNRGPEPCGEYRIAHGKKGLNDRKCHFPFAYMCKIELPVHLK